MPFIYDTPVFGFQISIRLGCDSKTFFRRICMAITAIIIGAISLIHAPLGFISIGWAAWGAFLGPIGFIFGAASLPKESDENKTATLLTKLGIGLSAAGTILCLIIAFAL